MSSIYRKKCLDRAASPERINEYIRICKPSVWLVLAAAILLLGAAVIWSIFGYLDTKVPAVAIADERRAVTLYAPAIDIDSTVDKLVIIDKKTTTTIKENMLPTAPVYLDDSFSRASFRVAGLAAGEWAYAIPLDCKLPSGTYSAEIVLDRVSPISFILN